MVMRRSTVWRLFLLLLAGGSAALLVLLDFRRTAEVEQMSRMSEGGGLGRVSHQGLSRSAPTVPGRSGQSSGLTEKEEEENAKEEAEEPSEFQQPLRRAFDLSPLSPSNTQIPEERERPWYMGGSLHPDNCPTDPKTGRRKATLLPEEETANQDRILDQLMYYPPKGQIPENLTDPDVPLKKILLSQPFNRHWATGFFLQENCPVNNCAFTFDQAEAASADLVMFKDQISARSRFQTFQKPATQLWMLYMLESPRHTSIVPSQVANLFNWTATYRSDATIVAPYERWQYYNENVRQIVQHKNYAANKTKAVAWFVSNCVRPRLQYAKELQKYIQVDIYGSCGTKICESSNAKECFQMLDREYKFYLAFENSNCKDYITEKFFINGLNHNVIPIAMGARPEDYKRSAPEHSYIHVEDFAEPKELAMYLHKLDQNDDLYNEYFQWKGTGQLINTKFMCRVCALLHDRVATTASVRGEEASHYHDINAWWQAPGTCIQGFWRDAQGNSTNTR